MYPISQVLDGLHARPSVWLGRTIIVRANFYYCAGVLPSPGYPISSLGSTFAMGNLAVTIPGSGDSAPDPVAPYVPPMADHTPHNYRITLHLERPCSDVHGGDSVHPCPVALMVAAAQ